MAFDISLAIPHILDDIQKLRNCILDIAVIFMVCFPFAKQNVIPSCLL